MPSRFKLAVPSLLFCSMLLGSSAPARSQETPTPVTIDVPVHLKEAKVLFNLGHPTMEDKDFVAFIQMERLLEHFKKNSTNGKIIGIFHGGMGYVALNDEAYNRVQKVTTGNPYKEEIKKLADAGVSFEFCGISLAERKWTNKDLLPQVKVNSGFIFRTVDLVQSGYVMLAP